MCAFTGSSLLSGLVALLPNLSVTPQETTEAENHVRSEIGSGTGFIANVGGDRVCIWFW